MEVKGDEYYALFVVEEWMLYTIVRETLAPRLISIRVSCPSIIQYELREANSMIGPRYYFF